MDDEMSDFVELEEISPIRITIQIERSRITLRSLEIKAPPSVLIRLTDGTTRHVTKGSFDRAGLTINQPT